MSLPVAAKNADVYLNYAPQGQVLRAFHKSAGFVRIIIGPLGSGKTQASISEVYRRIHNQKPRVVIKGEPPERISRWGVVRNTYTDLINTTIKDFNEMMDPIYARGAGRFSGGQNPTAHFDYMRQDGTRVRSEVMFLAYDRPEDQRKARGLQVTGLWLNEVKELNQTVVTQLVGRVGRFPAKADLGKYWQGVIGDCNAPDADHWLGKQALRDKDALEDQFGAWEFFIQPGAVSKKNGRWVINTQAENYRNLPDNYYQRQIAGATNEAWIRVNLGNEFILFVDGRPVHPDYNQIYHATDGLSALPGRTLTVGIDFGRTPAAAIMQRQLNGAWWIVDEVTSTNTGARRFGRVLRDFLNERYSGYHIDFYGDPAGDDMAQTDDETPMMMLAESDIDCYPAPTNNFEERITSLDRLLTTMIDGQPAVKISKRCTTINKGLSGAYQFRRMQTSQGDRYTDKPDKTAESHVCEAVHYGLLGAGEGEALYEAGANEQIDMEADEDFEGWHPEWTGL